MGLSPSHQKGKDNNLGFTNFMDLRLLQQFKFQSLNSIL